MEAQCQVALYLYGFLNWGKYQSCQYKQMRIFNACYLFFLVFFFPVHVCAPFSFDTLYDCSLSSSIKMVTAGWIEFLTEVHTCFGTGEIPSPVGWSDIVRHLVNPFPLFDAVLPLRTERVLKEKELKEKELKYNCVNFILSPKICIIRNRSWV